MPPIAAAIELIVGLLFCSEMVHIRESEVAAAELVRASVAVLLENVTGALLHLLIAPRHDVRIYDPLLLLVKRQLRWHELGPHQKTGARLVETAELQFIAKFMHDYSVGAVVIYSITF